MSDKLYLENLEEEILQLNNVITYKWLVRTLKVPANIAKQMLYEFVEKQIAAGIKINATFLVAGQKKKDNAVVHEVCLVPSSRLESVKSSFDKISCIHIYGVHKGPLQDQGVLYATDYDANQSNTEITKKGCMIICESAKFKDECFEDVKDVGVVENKLPEEKKPVAEQQELVKSRVVKRNPPNKKGALDNMFSNMKKKPETEQVKPERKSDLTVQKDINGSLQTKMSKFSKPSVTTSSIATTFSAISPLNDNTSIKIKDEPPDNNERPSKRQKKEKVKIDCNSNPKKRRRIIQVFDSSSDEEAESPSPPRPSLEESEDESENPLPPSPSKEPTKYTKCCQRVIEETTVDEDGYLVTQKKLVVVDEPDDGGNENEDPLPSQTKKTEIDDQLSKQHKKNRQGLLTSFFKRT